MHKVIRWAFEAQGMYNPRGQITNAPGQPPAVDIYIESGRSRANERAGGVQYGPGSYFPVSLDWDPDQTQADAPPAWQAAEDAIVVNGNAISVRVGNRGTQAAEVAVSVWYCAWPAGAKPPQWNDGPWNQCTPASLSRND